MDDVGQEDEQEKSGDERHSEAGSEEAPSDYDVEEEYDNDYAENYFDNGEGDDLDNLGDGGMGDEGGGAGMFIIFSATCRRTFSLLQVTTGNEFFPKSFPHPTTLHRCEIALERSRSMLNLHIALHPDDARNPTIDHSRGMEASQKLHYPVLHIKPYYYQRVIDR